MQKWHKREAINDTLASYLHTLNYDTYCMYNIATMYDLLDIQLSF